MNKSWADSLDLLAILLILIAVSIGGLYAGIDYREQVMQKNPPGSERSAQHDADADTDTDSNTKTDTDADADTESEEDDAE